MDGGGRSGVTGDGLQGVMVYPFSTASTRYQASWSFPARYRSSKTSIAGKPVG